MTTHEEFEVLAAIEAAGAATAEESRVLEEHLRGCEPCARALDEFSEAAALLAGDLSPVAPPPQVRSSVLSAVRNMSQSVAPDEEAASVDPAEDANVSRWRPNPWWLATAATLFLAMWGWREVAIRAAKEQMDSQQAEIRRLSEENQQLAQQKERLSSEITELASVDTRTIALSGQQISPQASAKVFLEPGKRRALVFFSNLPENAKDRSYQLWIIRADDPSKPQSAGVFDANPTGSASLVIENLPLATEIKALAVTLEPRGGVQSPTNTNFYVMGNS